MAVNTAIEVVGIDWGTTHRRAYALDGAGHCIAELADSEGALACKGRFDASLRALLDTLQARPRAIILTGMVGSALGWQVVPYVDGSVPLAALGLHMAQVGDAAALTDPTHGPKAASIAIVPGYCVRDAAAQPDVMRGEEAQLLGAHCLGHSEGWFVLPGTHSKWVELRAGRVVQLRTYMTGELFDLLGAHGTLAAAAGATAAVWDAAAFALGVRAAQTPQGGGALSHQLFACRARVVSGDMPASSSRSYLSGLLIGTEMQDVLRDATTANSPGAATDTSPGATFKLIGSPALATHYQAAAAQLGLQFEVLDARAAFVAAIHHLDTHRIAP
jgi:2-dehydro-3-deoxygalactonokinase